MSDYDEKTLRPILEGYCAVVNAGLEERRQKITSKYSEKEYEVVVGLMAREAELSIQLAGNVGIWNGGIPPLVIRCMVDCFIILSWILENVEKHTQMYLKNSHDRFESMIDTNEKAMEIMVKNPKNVSVTEAEKIAQALKDFPGNIQMRELAQHGLDGWNIKDDARSEKFPSMKKMAKCADKEMQFYDCLFPSMSLMVHNNWYAIKGFLVKSEENPFTLVVGEASDIHPGLAADLISNTYATIDEKLELQCSSDMPIVYWVEHFPDKFPANTSRYFENILNNDKAE